MGFGVESFYYFKCLEQRKKINLSGKLLDIGSQEYDVKTSINNYLVSDITDKLDTYDSNGAKKGELRHLAKYLGFSKYESYDIDGRFGSIPVDFNEISLDDIKPNSDWIFNLGTTEHIYDQSRVFEFIHKNLKKNGFLYQVLPYSGYIDHGLYSYSPTFFISFAKYNDYEIVDILINPNNDKTSFVNLKDSKKIRNEKANIIVLMKKKSDSKYVKPLQLSNPMVVLETFSKASLRDKQFMSDEIKVDSFRLDPHGNNLIKYKRKKNLSNQVNFSLVDKLLNLLRKK